MIRKGEFKTWFQEMAVDFTNKSIGDTDRPVNSRTVSYLRKTNKKLLAYHGTAVSNFWSILQKGFVSNKKDKLYDISYKNTTYFGTDPSVVADFAEYDTESIIFVAELPGNLLKGDPEDDVWVNSIMAKKVIPPQNIVGVIYPPGEDGQGKFYPIKQFVQLVNKGKFSEIPPSHSAVSVGEPTPPDVENFIADYIGQLARKVGLDDYLAWPKYESSRPHVLPLLPPYDKLKNWLNKDIIRFLQQIANRRWNSMKMWKGDYEQFVVPPNSFSDIPDLPLSVRISSVKPTTTSRSSAGAFGRLRWASLPSSYSYE